jgi:hypothetical protein
VIRFAKLTLALVLCASLAFAQFMGGPGVSGGSIWGTSRGTPAFAGGAGGGSGGGAGGGSGCASCLTGLVAYYAFENNANDSQGAYNATTNTGSASPTYPAGKVGLAIANLTGGDMRVNYTASGIPTLASDFTVAGWVNVNAHPGTGGTILNWGGGFAGFYVDGPTRKFSVFNGSFFDSTGGYVLDTWAFAVVTFTPPNSFSFYVDGVAAGTASTAYGSGATATYSISLGGAAILDGILDELGIWNRVLTPAEITSLYNSGSGRTYPFN